MVFVKAYLKKRYYEIYTMSSLHKISNSFDLFKTLDYFYNLRKEKKFSDYLSILIKIRPIRSYILHTYKIKEIEDYTIKKGFDSFEDLIEFIFPSPPKIKLL